MTPDPKTPEFAEVLDEVTQVIRHAAGALGAVLKTDTLDPEARKVALTVLEELRVHAFDTERYLRLLDVEVAASREVAA